MPLTEKIFCRTFQKGLFLSLPFLPYRDPEILQSIDSVAIHLQRFNLKKCSSLQIQLWFREQSLKRSSKRCIMDRLISFF